MNTFYRIAYRVGFHPWEDAVGHPPFVERITELFEQEEARREPPYGRALDVGTGSGIWAVELPNAAGRSPESTSSITRSNEPTTGSGRPGSTCGCATLT